MKNTTAPTPEEQQTANYIARNVRDGMMGWIALENAIASAIAAARATDQQRTRATVLEEVAIWLDGFEFPEAQLLAKQARVMAKDAIEDCDV